ncbi:MAG: rhamnogalacturonan acetylesterase [Verrucomicrobia bacterium]|nr:rhamnogalacturonan acetylesterase [Verrucomicrobiota bacterium]
MNLLRTVPAMRMIARWAVTGIVCASAFHAGLAADAKPKVRVALVGDSTVAEKSGWGPAFAKLLGPGAVCTNFALGGRSSKSFRDEGQWAKVIAAKPDYVLIQFGHNDMPGKGPARETDPNTTYRENMIRYVDEARAIGATPILVTSMARRTFQNGKIRGELAPWADAVKKVAAEKQVPLVDLFARSIALLEKLGPEGSAVFDPPTKDGQPDHTHLSAKGGEAMARLIVGELRKVEPKLGQWLAP